MEMARVAAAKEGGGGECSGDESGVGEGGEGAGGGVGGGGGGSLQRRTASRLPSGAVPSAMEMARRRISLPRGWQGAGVATRWTDSAEGHEKHMHTAKHRLRHSRLKGWAAPS